MTRIGISKDPILTRRLSIAGVVALLFFLNWQTDSLSQAYRFSQPKTDYYNLLTEGFIRGSTAMHVDVHPGMLSSDPEVRRQSPSLLDANFYHGKYYLYYGVVPALFLFTPYRLLTGYNLPPELAVLLGVLMGYFAATRIWRAARLRYFHNLGSGGEVAAHLLLGLSTATPFLVARSSFYEVPIASGYACVMGACLACYHALHREPRRASMTLAAASLALGMAVGCRPNYLLATPALLAVALVIIYRRKTKQTHQNQAVLMTAAILPALLIGVGLGAYNFARFGNPLEFGFNYGINSFFDSGATLMSWHFIWPNLRWIYFSPPEVSPYFPYVFPVAGSFRPAGYFGNEAFHGQFFSLLLVIWILIGIALSTRTKVDVRGLVFKTLLVWIGLSSLVFMTLLTIRGNRYVVDFQASFILLGVLVAGRTWSALRSRNFIFSIWRTGLVLLAGISATSNFLGAVQQFDQFANQRPTTFKQLARFFDPLAYKLTNILSDKIHGPIEFYVSFSAQKKRVIEPLVIAGLSEYTDGVYVIQHPDKRIELIMDHHGYGGPRSKPFPIEIGRDYKFEVDLGAFYPPQHHQFFDSCDEYTADKIKTNVSIRVDGRKVLDRKIKAYDAPLGSISFGINNATNNPYMRYFSGVISRIKYQNNFNKVIISHVPPINRGPIRLKLQLPQDRYGFVEPLFQQGSSEAFDAIAIKYERPGFVRLLHDQLGGGGRWSKEFAVDYNQAQWIELDLPGASDGVIWSTTQLKSIKLTSKLITINLNGVDVFQPELPLLPNDDNKSVLGRNLFNASSSLPFFSGEIEELPRLKRLGLVKSGIFISRFSRGEFLDIGRGVLLRFERADGNVASLVWQKVKNSDSFRIGWMENTRLEWFAWFGPDDFEAVKLCLEFSPLNEARRNTWLEIIVGDKGIYAHKTPFFDGQIITAWGADKEAWRGPVLEPTDALTVNMPMALPGRLRLAFQLPVGGFLGSDPLLSAGRVGAADSIFLRGDGTGRYVVGLDHWGLGALESTPVALAPEQVHTLVVELASLGKPGELPSGRARLVLDGQVVLDVAQALYPVEPKEIVFGLNPHGMSTSSAAFRGEIVSVRAQAAADDTR